MNEKKYFLGFNKNNCKAFAYIFGLLSGLVILFAEKDVEIRFHAMQSILLFMTWLLVTLLLSFTIILAPLIPLAFLLFFIFWLLSIYNVWEGRNWSLPILGKLADKYLNKI